jgi:hypothetical protein
MKTFQLSLIAGTLLLITGGVAQAADLEDLDITVRVVEDDDAREMRHELRLPAAAREHHEDRDHDRDGHDNNDDRDGHDDGDRDGHDDDRDGYHSDREDHEGDREEHDEDRDEYEESYEEHHDSEEHHDGIEELEDREDSSDDATR